MSETAVTEQELLGLRLLELHAKHPELRFHEIHDEYLNRQLTDFKPSKVVERIEYKRGG